MVIYDEEYDDYSFEDNVKRTKRSEKNSYVNKKNRKPDYRKEKNFKHKNKKFFNDNEYD